MHVSFEAVEVVVLCIISLDDSNLPRREWFQGASVLSRLFSPRWEVLCPDEKVYLPRRENPWSWGALWTNLAQARNPSPRWGCSLVRAKVISPRQKCGPGEGVLSRPFSLKRGRFSLRRKKNFFWTCNFDCLILLQC